MMSTRAVTAAILPVVANEPLHLFVLNTRALGPRQGEALALRWSGSDRAGGGREICHQLLGRAGDPASPGLDTAAAERPVAGHARRQIPRRDGT